MKRTYLFVFLFPLALVLLVGIATNRESWTEINTATGAMRTRTTHAVVFTKPWVEKSTWVSERAAQLGINTESSWQLLSHREDNWGMVRRGCGETPASFHFSIPYSPELSQEQEDSFIRSFVKADEETRRKLIRELVDAG